MPWDNTLEFINSVVTNIPRKSAHTVPDESQNIKKEISLVRWRVAFSASSRAGLFSDVAVQVEGIRTDDGEHWTSSEVQAVELPRTIHTANTIYHLIGKIDARISLEKGMPHEFINKFTNGFPDDWKETIDEFIDFLFQHAGRQRNVGRHAFNMAEQENLEPEVLDSVTRVVSVSPLNSPSTQRSPLSSASTKQSPSVSNIGETPCKPSVLKTPQRKSNLNFKNVTVRRTATRNSSRQVKNDAALTPVLTRSQRGRLIKPRLAPGERILYDCYGSPIEARQNVTRTHISNRSSKEFAAVCKTLNLVKAKSPTQVERRLSVFVERRKSRRSSMAQQRKKLSKLLAYNDSDDKQESDESLNVDNNLAELTPIRLHRPAHRRFIESDDEPDEVEQTPQSKRPKRNVKTKQSKNSRTVTKASPKSKSKKERPKKVQLTEKTFEVEAAESTVMEHSAVVSTPVVEPVKTKPKAKIWNAKNKRDLEAAFHAFNPCNDRDWELVIEALPVIWSVEEVKAQAKKMRLKPLISTKPKSPKTTLVQEIRNLLPDGKLPQKGTIRRELLEDKVKEQLYLRRIDNPNENQLGEGLDDSEDLFVREAMQSHALDESLRLNDRLNKYTTPSKRTYFPKAVSACRRRSSLAAIESIGDDFSMPDKSKMKYRLKYRAQQFNRAHRMASVQENNDNSSIASDSFN